MQSRLVGGTHGYGAKLTNIFSKQFEIQTYNAKKKQLYTQQWQNNMNDVQRPCIAIENDPTIKDYTKITFQPDLERFGISTDSNLTDSGIRNSGNSRDFEGVFTINDAIEVFQRRAYDMAASLKGVKITFNGEIIPITSFHDYVNMFRETSVDGVDGADAGDIGNIGDIRVVDYSEVGAMDGMDGVGGVGGDGMQHADDVTEDNPLSSTSAAHNSAQVSIYSVILLFILLFLYYFIVYGFMVYISFLINLMSDI